MDYQMESFIGFCDNMMIAEEGLTINRIKEFLKQMILKVLHKIDKWINKIKNDRIRNRLLSFNKRLKALMGEVDVIKEENVSNKYNEISKEVDTISKEVDETIGQDDAFINENDKTELVDNKETFTVVKKAKTTTNGYYYQVNFNNEEFEKKVYQVAIEMAKADNYNDYIINFKEFKKLLNIPDKSFLYALSFQKGTFNCTYVLESNRMMKRNIDKPLYHTSKDPNLTHLTGRWRVENQVDPDEDEDYKKSSHALLLGRFFDTPRIFFGVRPMDRMGGTYLKNRYVYKAEGIKEACIDIDGITYGQSIYVETKGSIPVKRLTDEELERLGVKND